MQCHAAPCLYTHSPLWCRYDNCLVGVLIPQFPSHAGTRTHQRIRGSCRPLTAQTKFFAPAVPQLPINHLINQQSITSISCKTSINALHISAARHFCAEAERETGVKTVLQSIVEYSGTSRVRHTYAGTYMAWNSTEVYRQGICSGVCDDTIPYIVRYIVQYDVLMLYLIHPTIILAGMYLRLDMQAILPQLHCHNKLDNAEICLH